MPVNCIKPTKSTDKLEILEKTVTELKYMNTPKEQIIQIIDNIYKEENND
jgi:DNA-binding transcriptional regulator YhcF (GntR family)